MTSPVPAALVVVRTHKKLLHGTTSDTIGRLAADRVGDGWSGFSDLLD
jgi:hypothetical protein